MTDEPPKKKSLAGLGQLMEKAAARDMKASQVVAEAAAETPRSYEITFRKKRPT